MADHFIYSPDPDLRHPFPQIPGDKPHKVLHIFRLSTETLPQLGALGCHAYRTGIQIAHTHHNTADGDQRPCSEAIFLCSQKRRHSDVAPSQQLTVCFNNHPVTEVVHQ